MQTMLAAKLFLHTKIDFSAFLNYNLPRARDIKDIK